MIGPNDSTGGAGEAMLVVLRADLADQVRGVAEELGLEVEQIIERAISLLLDKGPPKTVEPIKPALLCEICWTPLHLAATDRHGIFACRRCCTPYMKSENAPPALIARDDWKPLLREYWSESSGKIPHAFDRPTDGISTSGFSRGDVKAWSKWIEARRAAGKVVPS